MKTTMSTLVTCFNFLLIGFSVGPLPFHLSKEEIKTLSGFIEKFTITKKLIK